VGASSPSLVGPGLLLVLLTALISGASTFANGYAVAGTSSAVFVTFRNLLVAFLVLPLGLLAFRGASERPSARQWGILLVIGLVGGAIPFLLFFQGIALATAAGGATTASFLYRTLFVLATVLGIVVLRERFHWKAVVGGALLLGGNFLLMALTTPVWTDGSAYVLAATLLWAGEYTLSKNLLRSLPSGLVAAGRMGFGAAFLLAYLGLTSQLGAVVLFSGAQWTWVALSAVLLSAFVGAWYAGLKRVDLGVATSVLVLGYPVTWLLAVAFQGAPLVTGELWGALLVVLGAFFVVGWRSLRELARWTLSRFPRSGRTTT
jgi:drug/metabolite transporter (DMT)-like permease